MVSNIAWCQRGFLRGRDAPLPTLQDENFRAANHTRAVHFPVSVRMRWLSSCRAVWSYLCGSRLSDDTAACFTVLTCPYLPATGIAFAFSATVASRLCAAGLLVFPALLPVWDVIYARRPGLPGFRSSSPRVLWLAPARNS